MSSSLIFSSLLFSSLLFISSCRHPLFLVSVNSVHSVLRSHVPCPTLTHLKSTLTESPVTLTLLILNNLQEG